MCNFCVFYKTFIIPNVTQFEIYGKNVAKEKNILGFGVSLYS